MNAPRFTDGPVALFLTLSAGALAWFCLALADLAGQVLR